MAKDAVYVNGIIAAKERGLLGGKLVKMCEANAKEAFRILSESGFGKGADAATVYEYEKLLSADERDIDAFIREYAPTAAIKAYLFAERDFHNAKALFKARVLGVSPENMLAPEGLYTIEELKTVTDGEAQCACKQINKAVEEATALQAESGISGAETGAIFERELFNYLAETCKHTVLKKLVGAKADMTNIMTAARSAAYENAEKAFVSGGKIDKATLKTLFSQDRDEAARAFGKTYLWEFYKLCYTDGKPELPLTRAERAYARVETEFFAANKYELKKSEPFLYYVFRRRAENADARIILVCLLANMDGQDIRKRLRSV